jgi:hypothetical protein
MATIFLIVERSHRLENESPDESSMVRLSFSEKKTAYHQPVSMYVNKQTPVSQRCQIWHDKFIYKSGYTISFLKYTFFT